MNKGEFLDDISFEILSNKIDSDFRVKIEKSILNTKLLTHKCQLNCYNQYNSLIKAEECAQNCFKPMIFIKKNVSNLIENAKEKLEKCKVNNKINNQTSSVFHNMEIRKCLIDYSRNLDEKKEEIEFIYDGYCKNFEELLKEKKD